MPYNAYDYHTFYLFIFYSTFTNNKYVFISTAFSHTSTILAGYIKI